jgi:ribosome-associated translation inhibitor RaiA
LGTVSRASFPSSSDKSAKRTLGRTELAQTPAVIRSTIDLGDAFERRIRARLARRIGHASRLVERSTVRFDDVNGPKGGVDIVCRIKLVVAGRPSLIVQKRAASAQEAFAEAVEALGTSLARMLGKHRLRAGRQHAGQRPMPKAPRARKAAVQSVDPGEIIGRRVGRGPDALARALQRPEKRDRAAYVDTAAPGVSASHRRAGGVTTARRNARARHPRATATLEDSRTRPSRKSTRRSANRGKPSHGKERAAQVAATTPTARAAKHGQND